jgi:alkylhydroperoxidase family enzyme
VLRYVEETSLERKTSDETEEELRQHFNDTERVELALIVGLWNMTNRLFNTLRVDLEPFVDKHHEELMRSTFNG